MRGKQAPINWLTVVVVGQAYQVLIWESFFSGTSLTCGEGICLQWRSFATLSPSQIKLEETELQEGNSLEGAVLLSENPSFFQRKRSWYRYCAYERHGAACLSFLTDQKHSGKHSDWWSPWKARRGAIFQETNPKINRSSLKVHPTRPVNLLPSATDRRLHGFSW